ncbi:trypsin-like peptidase domain-containing protein [Streptomyces sp. ST1015]|uniref:trypsin-like peptidase domain-containing protein n=1 Tax=unclassified Streptomyces TaxID=2593676 RepID=UPI001CA74F5B|nr:trypsin-like peptidase domain-containing protein [Streptomyces sp. ST1015]QZZ30125.1 tetratricopeptide repeat protein [Streptomyces sp. ST1015]
MPDRLRTALVEAAGQGSGLVLAPRLVLTAAHVLRERTHATVRTPRTPAVRCAVVWSRFDRHYDAALLLAEEDVLPSVDPVRWGTLVTSEPTDITLLGFAAGPGDQIGSRPFRGDLDPLDAVERDRYVLNLTGTPPEGASPWAGLSGGAVWCRDLLVGVAVADLPGWPHSRLEAIPAYVLLADPGFRGLLREHTGQDAPLEPAEFADRAQPSAPLVPASVALLLHPRAETVRFTGRTDLLAELTAWCQDGDGVSLALLTGAGGAGKSRVARELGHRLAASRHAVVHLARSAVPDALFASTTAPVLLVVDYAESRVGQLGALLEIVARRPRGVALRILLIARAQGRWWDELRAHGPEAADLAENARRWSITGTESLGADPREVFRTAVTDLARGVAALGLPVAPVPGPAPARPPRTVLEIHMAALASLLAPSAGTAAQDTLLRHEAAYWRSASRDTSLNLLGEAALRNAVVTATLVGPVPRERAHALLAHVPRIGDQPEAVRRAVADWLRDLYPSTAYWGVLEPDPLGEYLVGTRVADEPEIFLRLIDVLDNEEMINALLVLSRASARVEGVAEVVYDAVRAAPGTLAPRLLGAVRRSAEPAVLVGALEVVLDEGLLPDERLVELAERMPLLSQALVSWSVRLQQQLVDLGEERSPLARAGALHNLAGRLVAAEQYDTALDTTTTALALLDGVPDAPAWLRGLLLGQRSRLLNSLGRPEESVTEGEEALRELSRAPDAEDPDIWTEAVAATLNNLSYGLAECGRFGEALERARDSVALRRELAGRHPHVLPGLARSLGTLSRHQRHAGDLAGALRTAEESLRVRRSAAEEEPDAYLAELASTLDHMVQILANLEDGPALVEAAREDLSVRRPLARVRPEAHLSSYVEILLVVADITEGSESREAAYEAVAAARVLVRDQGREHLLLLGSAFRLQARSLASVSHPAVAFRVYTKAAQILRRVFRETGEGADELLGALDAQARFYLLFTDRVEAAEHLSAEALAVLAALPEDAFPDERAAALDTHARVREALTPPPDKPPPPPDPAA